MNSIFYGLKAKRGSETRRPSSMVFPVVTHQTGKEQAGRDFTLIGF